MKFFWRRKNIKLRRHEGNGEEVDCACAQHENMPSRTAKETTKAEILDETTKCAQPNNTTPSTGTATPVSCSVTVAGRGTVETAETGQIASNIRQVGRQFITLVKSG